MGSYNTALMTKAITSGLGDIVGAYTGMKRMELMKRDQIMQEEQFGLMKKRAEREEIDFQEKHTPVSVDKIKLALDFPNQPREVQELFKQYIDPVTVDIGGTPSVYQYRIDDFKNRLISDPQMHTPILLAKQKGFGRLKKEYETMMNNPELEDKVKKDLPDKIRFAVEQEDAATKELSMNPHYQAKMKAEMEEAKTKQGEESWKEYVSAVSEPFGLNDDEFNAIANAGPELGQQMLQERRLTQKTGKTENLSQDVDTFGVTKVGSAYNTIEGKNWVMNFLATPQGQKEFQAFRKEQKQSVTIQQTYNLIPETKTLLAGMFLRTGQMPALGMNAAAARTQILNEAGNKRLLKEIR